MSNRPATSLAQLLRENDDTYSSRLRHALFGSTDPAVSATALNHFVGDALGPINDALFVKTGVGLVVGVALADGRHVVVKVHRWNADTERLNEVQRVQRLLAADGLPVPKPMVPPTPVGAGIATAEEFLAGTSADGHEPVVRESIAAMLARFVAAARQITPTPRVGTGLHNPDPNGPLWREPHDLRFDFDATAAGAEWIDELAATARARLLSFADISTPRVVAHLDWRVENLGFTNDDVTAIYDWDSVGIAPEAVAMGHCAASFSTDWRVGRSTMPTLQEMRLFVRDYERLRGIPFSTEERRLLDAANLMSCAYGARCEHSDRILQPELAGAAGTGWDRLLRERGLDGLA